MTKPTRLASRDIVKRLAKLNGEPPVEHGWQRVGRTLIKEFVRDSFTGAVKFLARIAPRANALDHHPDLQLYHYKHVIIVLTTHDAGGLTRKDFELAAIIDELAAR